MDVTNFRLSKFQSIKSDISHDITKSTRHLLPNNWGSVRRLREIPLPPSSFNRIHIQIGLEEHQNLVGQNFFGSSEKNHRATEIYRLHLYNIPR
jgi:hypothetical protein